MGKDLKGNPLPPGIMQRKSGIYRGRFYYKGETYTKDNADLKKLVQEMEDLRYEVKHGLKGKGDNITLDTWFDIWLNTHKKRTIKESTQVRYDDFYRRYIKKQIGKQRVADFNPIILERLLQNMADDDYSTKTMSNSLERANNGNKAENIILKENIRGTNGRGTSAFDDAANQYIE